ncbi:MAG: serine/threonine-protein kinase, partial [Pirellulales bacterium]
MSKLSLDKFLEFVGRSKLVEPARLDMVVSDWKRRATIAQLDDAGQCAEHLIEAGLLTRWQAHKLLEGRHRGFQLGKYKLLDHLGSGGMSSVYLAEHTLMRRLAAVKVLPQHRVSDASYVARFQLEGQSTAALDHPNIVRVYDLDHDGKIHYLVMEYIEGRDLEAIVARQGSLNYLAAADYIAQAAAGLEHAHRAGLVHRDVKPANLLVDRHGVVKILDMGLAKFAGAPAATAALVGEEQVLGTADYVAPEQTVNSNTVDCRADIYSLGCTLYFLLSGHPPFPFGSALQRMSAHQHHLPPSVALDRPDAPQALVAICERMMAKSPADRYASAGEVRTALSAWLASDAALALSRNRSLAAAGNAAHFDGGDSGFDPRPAGATGDSNVHGSSGSLRAGS